MKVMMILLAVLTTVTVFAQKNAPSGTRALTLHCVMPMSLENGDSMYVGSQSVRITLNNDVDPAGNKILGVAPQTVDVLSSVVAPNAPVTVVPAASLSPRHDRAYATANGDRVYVYSSKEGCLRAKITAVLISGNAISNCTQVVSDVMSGIDFAQCK